ncbi:MAG: AAA family ATPase [Methanophagales archaeon]|nr:AAA family ATPase [Methanophagales archaeon]
MGEIKKITISGFRGINTSPLELDFQKDESIQSMMIYGKNGSGKSSIVDAWEWLYSGRIEHLAREGAGERAFPHKEAKGGQTWIEIEFTNKEIGKIRAEFDPSRITRPKIEGNLSKMKEFIPYPCHLRYRDITEFVYERKARKYEILSYQMGFGKALDIQNQLQTGAKRLEEELEELKRDRDGSSKEYREASGEEPKDIARFIKILNGIFTRHGIAPVKEKAEVSTSFAKLREKVEKDEKSKKLSLWKDIQRIINQFYPVEDIRSNISKFHEDFTEFKQDEEAILKLVLLDLYEKGIEAIESLEIYDRCPLCDQPYEGNLIEHIKSKQSHLDVLSDRRNKLEKRRKELFSSIDGIIRKIEHTSSDLEEKELESPLIRFNGDLKNLILSLKECRDILEKKIEDIDKGSDFLTKVDTKEFGSLLDSESEIKEEISRRVENLEKDETRKALVDDFQAANKLQESFLKWSILNKKIERLEEIKSAYEKVRGDYVEETKKSVQESFDAISSDVAAYFKILEQDIDVLGDPKIKLYSERDKAVELEIMFGGDPISPAYKFLSESQLNSFGLSIFLASAKHFNPNFKFIILDDVTNSFDTYKRPRVIDLLSKHFSEYQILLFTHDSIWLDRLQKSFPQWIRKRFSGWDYMIGPRIEPGKNSYEQIDELLSQDKPTEAGWMFGRYLEWVLQELCENLESSVKYNRRNEYTLSELFQAFRVRMQKKLKSDNSIVKLISDFEADTGFRNFCDHWKESETDYSSPEVRDIVQNWKDIERKIECDECHKFIKYEKVDGYEHISCPCRKLNLKADEYYMLGDSDK